MTGPDWRVLDASVLVKCLIVETNSVLARRVVAAHPDWIAPDFIYLEVASVAMKSARMGLIDRGQAVAMVDRATQVLSETVSSEQLRIQACSLAIDHGLSAYDAAYLALAQDRGVHVVTADEKLVARATANGIGHLVRDLRSS